MLRAANKINIIMAYLIQFFLKISISKQIVKHKELIISNGKKKIIIIQLEDQQLVVLVDSCHILIMFAHSVVWHNIKP